MCPRSLYPLVFLGLLCAGTALGQDRFFDSGGVRIRYVDRGAGPPVVLVHGFTASIETSWIDTGVLPDLVRDHRVVAMDLRGHGKSDKPRDPRAYDELGMDVVRLLDHLGIERAHVVGYSLGGIVVAKLLTTHAERFLTAVIGGAAYRRSQSEHSDRAAEALSALPGIVWKHDVASASVSQARAARRFCSRGASSAMPATVSTKPAGASRSQLRA